MKLTVVGLPLGNIEDITVRALRVIFEADIILAEDTRNVFKLKSILRERFSSIILDLNILEKNGQKVYSYRDQNHNSSFPEILKFTKENKEIILVSDAGMPTISDPGFKLVRDLIENGVEVDVFPGPTALDSALVISGLPTDSFIFLGFLPRENGKIKKALVNALDSPASTIILYESPFRILKTIEIIETIQEEIKINESQNLKKKSSEIKVVAINDLTKKFQKTIRGSAIEILNEMRGKKIVGEWVILLSSK